MDKTGNTASRILLRLRFGQPYFFLQLPEGIVADGMFHPAGILLRDRPVYTGGYELLREEQMPLIDLLGDRLTRSGQVEIAAFADRKEAFAL